MTVRTTFFAGLGLLLACSGPRAAEPRLDSGVDPKNIDPAVRPQDDLFFHVNGGWFARTEIPAERSVYGSFIQLAEKSEATLREIIEQASQAENPPGSVAQKVGDLYADFMDEAKINALGKSPIEPELAEVEAIADARGLVLTLAKLGRGGIGGPVAGYVDTDAKQSDRYILNLSQAGLGLPDESYYREAKHQALREAYVEHVAKMLELAGVADPKKTAEVVMAHETLLASGFWDRVKNRDSTLTYNKFDLKGLNELAPAIDWDAWFTALGAKTVGEVVVNQPSYLAALSQHVREVPLDRWKTWLKWRVVHGHAANLGQPFVDENFRFYGKRLTGAQENRPRWKRGVSAVEAALGEAVGKIYVEKTFPPEAKQRMEALVKNLIAAYREDIQTLEWMTPETRQKALDKLAKFTPKIAYPDKWRDYSKLEIVRGDLVGNMRRAAAFEVDRELRKLGGPVDRDEWHMTPQTVNAYYNPGMNEIVFPAAILQPPFFDLQADDAVNYGGIGAVIGHEIGHGFDDQGSRNTTARDNLEDWWTDADRTAFEERTKAAHRPVRRAWCRRASRPEPSRERRAHDRREHRRPRRPDHRPQGVPDLPRRQGGPRARRPDRHATAVLRLGADLAVKIPDRGVIPTPGRRPPLPHRVPLQRRGPQRPGILRGVPGQAGGQALPARVAAGADLVNSR